MSLNKPVTEIQEKDLQELIDNKVAEQKTIDYKATLPGSLDSEKREFLRDVSSFANSAGGHLIYGMLESSGVPTTISPLMGNPDQEILRLESIMRDGIEPSSAATVRRAGMGEEHKVGQE